MQGDIEKGKGESSADFTVEQGGGGVEHTLVISLMIQSGYKCLKEEGGRGGGAWCNDYMWFELVLLLPSLNLTQGRTG